MSIIPVVNNDVLFVPLSKEFYYLYDKVNEELSLILYNTLESMIDLSYDNINHSTQSCIDNQIIDNQIIDNQIIQPEYRYIRYITNIDVLYEIAKINNFPSPTYDIISDEFVIKCSYFILSNIKDLVNNHDCEQSFDRSEYEIIKYSLILIDSYHELLYNINRELYTMIDILSDLEKFRIKYNNQNSIIDRNKILIEYYNYKRLYVGDLIIKHKYDIAIIECARAYLNTYKTYKIVNRYSRKTIINNITLLPDETTKIHDILLINPAYGFSLKMYSNINKEEYPILYNIKICTQNLISSNIKYNIIIDQNIEELSNIKSRNNNIYMNLNLLNQNDLLIIDNFIMYNCNKLFMIKNKILKDIFNKEDITKQIFEENKAKLIYNKLDDLYSEFNHAKLLYDNSLIKDKKYNFMYYLSCVFALYNNYEKFIDSFNYCEPHLIKSVCKIAFARSNSVKIQKHCIKSDVGIDILLFNIAYTKSVSLMSTLSNYLLELHKNGWYNSLEQIFNYKNVNDKIILNINTNHKSETIKNILLINNIIKLDKDKYQKKKDFYISQLRKFYINIELSLYYLIQNSLTIYEQKIALDIVKIVINLIEKIFEKNIFGKISDFNHINLLKPLLISVHNKATNIFGKLAVYVFTYDISLPKININFIPSIYAIKEMYTKFKLIDYENTKSLQLTSQDIFNLIIKDSRVKITHEYESNEYILNKVKKIIKKTNYYI